MNQSKQVALKRAEKSPMRSPRPNLDKGGDFSDSITVFIDKSVDKYRKAEAKKVSQLAIDEKKTQFSEQHLKNENTELKQRLAALIDERGDIDYFKRLANRAVEAKNAADNELELLKKENYLLSEKNALL